MYRLIITEKASVAQSIGRALGVNTRRDGYIEGEGLLISWCVGHLAELAGAAYYDKAYKRWQMADLPIVPKDWRYIVPRERVRQFKIVQGLMDREDVDEVINACDAGREGELIFRNVYLLAGCKKPMKRLWISSMEPDTIRTGLDELHDGAEYDRLYQAALCRAKADWLVGINGTRLYSILYHRTLHVGRVMSAALAMIAQRETDIRSFTPTPFYTPVLKMGDLEASGKRYETREEAIAIAESCGNTATVKKVAHKEHTSRPPALFDLTTLQREANRRCGFTAQQTLDYLQSLYEKRLCTYPRTDSRYFTDDMESSVPAIVNAAASVCGRAVPEAILTANVCDSGRVSDHHAIVPTATAAGIKLDELPAGEAKVLGLVCWAVLRAVASDYRFSETVVTFDCGGQEFTTRGRTVIASGWMQYEKPEDVHTLPDFAEGQTVGASCIIREGRTSPPSDFTEDTLLAAMEKAGSADMPEDVERRGIGTPATRAGIIEKLIAGGFVERKKAGKQAYLVPAQIGMSLAAVLPEQLKSPKLTADWEQQLKMVERGELAPAAFLYEIEQMLREIIYNAKPIPGAEELFPTTKEVLGRCPCCGSRVTEAKLGFFCEASDCKFALWKDNVYLTSKRIKLDADMVRSMLADGQALVRGIYSAKTDSTYDAYLVLRDDGQRPRYHLSFDFD